MVLWSIDSMVNSSNSERLMGFGDGLTDRRTFTILELLLRLKIEDLLKLKDEEKQPSETSI